MIFEAIPRQRERSLPPGALPPLLAQVLLYVQFFRFAGQRDNNGAPLRDPHIAMYRLEREFRQTEGQMIRKGEVVPLSTITNRASISPIHGLEMDRGLSSLNSLELPRSFYVNDFVDKELYHTYLTELL